MAHGTRIVRYLVSLVLCALCLGLVSPTSPIAAASSTYMDPMGAYTFTLPDGWEVNLSNEAGVLVNNADGSAIFILSIAPADGRSLDAAAQDTLAIFAMSPAYMGAPAGEVSDLTFAGQPAKVLRLQSQDPNVRGSDPIVVVTKDTVYYLLFATRLQADTDPGKKQAIDADTATILNSWKFI